MRRIKRIYFYPGSEMFFRVLVVLSSMGFVPIWILGYFNYDFHDLISASVFDSPGKIPSPIPGIGKHYFGDFLYPLTYIQQGNPWNPIYLPKDYNYTPLATIILKLFSLFPYKLALYIFLLIGIICCTIPIFYVLRSHLKNKSDVKEDQTHNQIVLVIGSLLSTGVVSAVDRGNYITWVVPLTFFAFFFIIKDRFIIASFFIAVAGALKIYPLIMVVIFLRLKKRKEIVITLFTTGILFVLPTLLIPGNFLNTNLLAVKSILLWTGKGLEGNDIVNISFFGALTNLLNLGNFDKWLTSLYSFSTPIMFLLLFLVCKIVLDKNIPIQLIFITLASSFWIVPSLSMPYVSVLILSALYFFHLVPLSETDLQRWKYPLVIFGLASMLTMSNFMIPTRIDGGIYNLVKLLQAFFWVAGYLSIIVFSKKACFQDK